MKKDSLIKYERPEALAIKLVPESTIALSGTLSGKSLEDLENDTTEYDPFNPDNS